MIMPESAIDWAMSQPDHSLSIVEAFMDLNQAKYSLGHSRYWGDPWQFQLVKPHLNSTLQTLIPQLNEELAAAFPKHLGMDTEEWKEIELESTVRKVIAQLSSRFIVGPPLCRNDDYLDLTYKVIDGMMTTIWATLPFPDCVRMITGPLASWRTQRHISKIRDHLKPLYKERLSILEGNGLPEGGQQPQDLLMVMLRFAQKKRRQELHDLDSIARRVCASSFVAMHQATIATTITILNVVGSDREFDTIATLRDEITSILGDIDGAHWSKNDFAQMTKCDSVARESMRLNFRFGTRGSIRRVMKDNIESPEGIKLQKGTTIAWLASCAQTDPDMFVEPNKFDPFRFSRAPPKDGQSAKNAFVTTSPQYLPFGHGRHACPGRFMVDVELKLILAHLLTHYDLAWPADYQGKQPPSVWQAELSMPPPGARILVRRRMV